MSILKEQRVSVVIPAYNEVETIGEIVTAIKQAVGADTEVIVVNDGSQDATGQMASGAGAIVINHPYNKGNGAAVKAGIRQATGDIIVLMDGDGQHDPADIPKLLEKMGTYDMVVGARAGRFSGPIHRRLANWIYNDFATYLARVKVLDLTSGFRAIKKDVIKSFLYLLPNTFSYPSTCTMALLRAGYSVDYAPIHIRKRSGKSKIHLVRDGARFFLILFRIATLFAPFRVFLPTSAIISFGGIAYSLDTIISMHRFTNMGMLLIVTGILLFFMGLIAEEIAMMRMERSEGNR